MPLQHRQHHQRTGRASGAADDEEPIDILDVSQIDGYWRQTGLRHCLDAAFAPTDGRPANVLHLHDWLTETLCRRGANRRPSLTTYQLRFTMSAQGLDWPCMPRVRRIAFTNSSHDLPGFNRFSREYFIFGMSHRLRLIATWRMQT